MRRNSQHAKSKLRDLALSSRTRDIISGCFSARNVETRLKKRQTAHFEFLFHPDTKYDPPQLSDVDDFVAYLRLALDQLEKQQLSVSDYQPRQLTPISLIRLQQETYRELLDKAEIE